MDVDKQPHKLSDLTDNASDTNQTDPPNLDTVQIEEPEKPTMEKSNKRLFLMGVVLAGVIALIVGGLFLTQRKESREPTQTPKPSVTSTPTPTETPKPAFERSSWTLEVLNGSGVTGAAKKLADQLQDLGYKIIKIANADRSDYTASELFVAKDLKDKQDLLLEDLKKEISIASVSGELTDSTASARIIIGKE